MMHIIVNVMVLIKHENNVSSPLWSATMTNENHIEINLIRIFVSGLSFCKKFFASNLNQIRAKNKWWKNILQLKIWFVHNWIFIIVFRIYYYWIWLKLKFMQNLKITFEWYRQLTLECSLSIIHNDLISNTHWMRENR